MPLLRYRQTRLTLVGAVILAVAAFVIVMRLGGWSEASGSRLLHEEPSEFAGVVVYEARGERCMSFDVIDEAGRQTCIRLDDPDKMVFEYTRMMTSALFVMPRPQNILIIGLGGGTLPTALAKLLPDATIDSVEIDPAVVRVAQNYFGYQTGPKQRVFVQDGREFIEQAGRDGVRYDMIMLDAFDIDYIPAHLLTVEFFQHVRSVLSDQGVLVANSFAGSQIYDRESATYAAVFGSFFNLRSRLDSNRVIIAVSNGLPSDAVLNQNALGLETQLASFGIDINTALSRYSRLSAQGITAEPLTD